MYRVCIALVDATRARLLTFGRVSDDVERHDELVEHAGLVSSRHETSPGDMPSDAALASRHTGHFKYAFDDHRDHSVTQLDAKFARVVLALLRELIDAQPTHCVVICAAPGMLQKLRKCAPGILPQELPLHELPYDLAKLSLDEVRAKLMADGQIAPCLVGGS